MMKSPTDWMPAVRHRRSQNALVDEVMAVVDALMRISSRTEGEFGSPAAEFFDNAVVRYCLADYWCEILRPEPEQVNGSGRFGKAPTNPLAINPYSAHDFTTGLPTDGLSATLARYSGRATCQSELRVLRSAGRRSAHFRMASSVGQRDWPHGVRRYSTFGGT